MDLIRRDGWGAAEPRGRPLAIPVPVRDLFLHHSASPDNGLASVQAIQRFHQQTRGWADIGYTWLYSPRDRVWFEGRGPGIAGAHTRNHNRTSHAVCVLGNYEASVPPAHVVGDLADWARWHGATWGPNAYRMHRDVGATACPGKYLAALLPDINALSKADKPREPQVEDKPAADSFELRPFPADAFADIYDGWHARIIMERREAHDE